MTQSKAARTVLYLEHAGALGGSCVSLRCMLEQLDPSRYRPIVALLRPTPAVRRLYEESGIEVVDARGIVTWEHTTAEWASLGRPELWPQSVRTMVGWRRAARETRALVDRVGPALVHLNSAVLAPSANVLRHGIVPFVWHVREAPVEGYAGLRSSALRRALRDWPAAALFLSERSRDAWGCAGTGVVANEFVDLARFDPALPRLDPASVRRALGIDREARVVLYAGGIAAIKGIAPLLEALAIARRREPRLLCLMPGARLEPPRTILYPIAKTLLPLLGRTTVTERVTRDLRRYELSSVCRMIPFAGNMPELMAASDVVVFPALEDHFARPVVEAGVLGKPIVASRFPLVEEQVEDGVSGVLVTPGDAEALGGAIADVLSDPARASRMGSTARARLAARHDARRNAAEVMRVYDEVVAGAVPRIAAAP